ncbi:type II restriction endonuclease [Bacillus sp. AFS096315]|uniref:type II restriction endonuclease n=1 Tax=Bacillus sp. AFS096315 TaxID=2033517 RepID=UPI000BEDB40F|nr:type II restriction endonuclease [Bacillus sp. AFS096315]PEC48941.1 restriction endonuclease [Bacillus sp. AFS096315]
MKKRNFTEWLGTMTDTVADWTYYTDFPKVFSNVDKIKVELSILNSLIGSKNIKLEFLNLLERYPEILKAIPVLIAKRMKNASDIIIIKDVDGDYYFDFRKREYSNEEYAMFMEKTGIFNLLENHLVSNLYDYVTGVEVGLDSNGRKNRTGHAMENVVENFIKDAGLVRDVDYFKEMYQSQISQKWGVDLSAITNEGRTEKRFDFVIKTNSMIYLIEVNFYSSGGSKLNETARSYKNITLESQVIEGVEFVWFTDGQGWNSARRNLEETFEVLPKIYNINDLKYGVIEELIK